MLGEECVAGLERHYLLEALVSTSLVSCSTNFTVPQECAGLLAGGNEWRGGLYPSSTSIVLSHPIVLD